MPGQQQTFTQKFTVRSSEAGPDGRIRLQALCDLFQEVAGNHALQLNFDVSQLKARKLTWFLRRLEVQIDRYPERREEITITTWPSRGDSLRAYRDFEVTDNQGETIASALSYWLMVNLESRRPVRMPREVMEMGPKGDAHVLPPKKEGPNPPEGKGNSWTFETRRSDLDLNNHINHTNYVVWLTETLPEGSSVNYMDIEFKSECRYGDRIRLHTVDEGDNTLCAGFTLTGSDRLLAAANLRYEV